MSYPPSPFLRVSILLLHLLLYLSFPFSPHITSTSPYLPTTFTRMFRSFPATRDTRTHLITKFQPYSLPSTDVHVCMWCCIPLGTTLLQTLCYFLWLCDFFPPSPLPPLPSSLLPSLHPFLLPVTLRSPFHFCFYHHVHLRFVPRMSLVFDLLHFFSVLYVMVLYCARDASNTFMFYTSPVLFIIFVFSLLLYVDYLSL